MTELKPLDLTDKLLDSWANDPSAPVALHLRQQLLPVEGEGGVIFPPTYADIGYNIDTLSDGTKVATIDSVGSQANRMEPIFKSMGQNEKREELNPLAKLVPQIEIELHTKGKDKGAHVERRSLLDLAHRSADAVVQSSPTLAALMQPAFLALRNKGDAGPLCALAPTSLVFGVWDSRGESGEKRPRLVRSVIRAWNVEVLHTAAQFNSVWKHLDGDQQAQLKAEEKLKNRAERSDVGLADAPSTFRKVERIPEYRDGSPNPERRVLGGVIARGEIVRDVTVNLVALRAIRGESPEKSERIRNYLLSLALIAASYDQELFLREGCLLRYAGVDGWVQVPRRGEPIPVDFSAEAVELLKRRAADQSVHFSANWPVAGKATQEDPRKLVHEFSLAAAKKLLEKKAADEAATK